MNALMRFTQVARKMGHRADFLFRPDMYKIPQYDAIYIRALTDPLNSAYVAARTAEMHGIHVIDDSDSIRICCDKVNMYRYLIRAGVPVPETRFVEIDELDRKLGKSLLRELGHPVVLKAPNSSFSMYVERADTPEEILKIAKRFFRRSDRMVAQRFVQSGFDWRVGILGGKPLYICQYLIPRSRWKISTYSPNGSIVSGGVKPAVLSEAKPRLLDIAVKAAEAIGNGLYGVDIKEVDNDFFVIEVNDNPTISAGEEDQMAGDLYERLVRYLLRE
jgi:glutathione synthase/RimK-type ligase-like ATP-grasp enzyme